MEGGTWGWGSARTTGVLALAAVALALFAARTVRHDNPLIDPALFRVRAFTGASTVAVVFSAAFGAMLLSRVLWAQDVWHWSALSTGISIVPGPIMVPLISFLLAGRLTARFGSGWSSPPGPRSSPPGWPGRRWPPGCRLTTSATSSASLVLDRGRGRPDPCPR